MTAHRAPRQASIRPLLLLAGLLVLAGCGDDPITRVAPGFMEADKRLQDMEGDTGGIETTIRELNAAFDASNRDYRVVVLADLVRGTNAEMEDAALKMASLHTGLVVDSADLLAEWSHQSARQAAE